MAVKHDVHAIIDALKDKNEMNAYKHDGCYELIHETVEAYARLADL